MRYEKAENLMQLALEMQSARQGVSLAEIGKRFGVGRRTAMRMRDAVIRNFPQCEEVTGDDRVKRWRLPSGTLDRLVGLGADELAALESAIRLLDRDNRCVEAALLSELSGKLRAVLKPELARKIEPDLEVLLEAEGLAMRPGPRPRIRAQVIVGLREAIKACHKVQLRYYSRRTRMTHNRLVHPYGFLHGHRNYLVGWHENPKANSVALFSLSNIEAVEPLEDSFVRDPGFDLERYAARSFGLFQEDPYEVVWRFVPEAAADAAEFIFHPSQRLESRPDGSLIVRFVAGSDLEMAWHLYAWGDKVEVLAPPRLAEMVHRHREPWPALP